MLSYSILFISAAALSYLLTPSARHVALRLGIVDRPEKRKMHQIPIPLLGGLPIFIAFSTVSAAAFFIWSGPPEVSLRSYVGLMAGATIILLLGIYDDAKGMKASAKFAGQALAALVVVGMGARIEAFTNPLGASFHLGWLGIPLALLWIVGVTNAVNLIDGLDGLAVGIGTIAAAGLFAVAAVENPFVAGVAIILAGAGLGFLRFNFYPAKIFLGDTGSMFIGFTLAVMGLHGSFKATTATVLFLPIIVLGVPIFDTLFAILRRAKRRMSPFRADREHIHHRLVRVGLHHRTVVLVMYFVCSYLALTAYSIAQFPYQTAFLFLVLLTMGGIIGLRTIQFIEDRLEAGALTPGGATSITRSMGPNGRAPNRSGDMPERLPTEFNSIICEISGLRSGLSMPQDLQVLGADIANMLSARLKVFGVVSEASAPGRVLLFFRVQPLTPLMEELVRSGLERYFEEHRERLSPDIPFPRVEWLRITSASPSSPETSGGEAEMPAPTAPAHARQRRSSSHRFTRRPFRV